MIPYITYRQRLLLLLEKTPLKLYFLNNICTCSLRTKIFSAMSLHKSNQMAKGCHRKITQKCKQVIYTEITSNYF